MCYNLFCPILADSITIALSAQTLTLLLSTQSQASLCGGWNRELWLLALRLCYLKFTVPAGQGTSSGAHANAQLLT